MANWHGCPCFPKGTAKTNRNSYNSFVRPNFSYAQVTNNTAFKKQQMAPRGRETSHQTEAVIPIPPIQPATKFKSCSYCNGNNSDIKALLATTA
ncbi:hypothetical protein TNIN_332331 [Trichonephila inaurata madagascariensis]|uniref:Uncharacterized protein n=1 Tax=Trichonephila inaurata madagascariensis TaxID=2747483 RepID=A0A8X6X952_9ARAC|nr:hypothetical protein TNIN_332331 [Trichonephila inaurata madagascariensis]